MSAGLPFIIMISANFCFKLIQDVDHHIVLSEMGCLEVRNKRSRSKWLCYAPGYLAVGNLGISPR
jgi:hypothetical protein